MMNTPLTLHTLFMVGPVAVTTPVVTTWAIMAVLTLAAALATRRLTLQPSRFQTLLEITLLAIDGLIRDTIRRDPGPYRPLIGTLLLFILVANWSSLVPGVEPPTAHLETDAAMALIVLVAGGYYGVRARGLKGYLATFAQPAFFMIPLNIAETFTRTFSLTVRLFGNVMSGVFILGIVLSLAGLFIPIPLMALDILTGAIQSYIFTVLAGVFVGSAVAEVAGSHHQEKEKLDELD